MAGISADAAHCLIPKNGCLFHLRGFHLVDCEQVSNMKEKKNTSSKSMQIAPPKRFARDKRTNAISIPADPLVKLLESEGWPEEEISVAISDSPTTESLYHTLIIRGLMLDAAQKHGTAVAESMKLFLDYIVEDCIDIWKDMATAKYLLSQQHELRQRGVQKKLENDKDGKQSAKVQIKQHWLDWRAGHERFASAADFDRKMIERYPNITSTKTIERNRSKWEAEMRTALAAATPKGLY